MTEPQRSIVTRIGYRHHHVSFHRVEAGQFPSHCDPNFTDVAVLDHAVRASEVNELEHTKRLSLFLERPFGVDAVVVDDDHFAWLYFADKLGVNEIKCTAFRRQNKGVFQFAQNQGSKTKWIANSHNFFLTHDHERERPMELAKGGQHVPMAGRLSEQVQNDPAIDGRLKNRPATFQLIAQGCSINQVTVVSDC